MKNKLSIFNLRRKYFIKMLAVAIKKIETQDDKIICYIDNNSLEKNKSQTLGYDYNFLDTNFFKYDKGITEKYDIAKPVYYVVENMVFNNKIRFHLKKNTHIIFRKCTFNSIIELLGNGEGEVIFENNSYSISNEINITDKPFIYANIQNIKFNNENFIGDISNEIRCLYFGMKIKAETIEIINSIIETKGINNKIVLDSKIIDILSSKINSSEICVNAENTYIYRSVVNTEYGFLDIKTNDLDLDSSTFLSSLISIESKSTSDSRTSIIAKQGIIIDTESNYNLCNILAPLIIYNDELKSSYNEEIVSNLKLSLTRTKLIQTLKDIKNRCENVNNYQTLEFKQNLENEPAEKILKLM